ncbi:MAG: hypothetical protein U0930_03300 [Pirellulales bacterium]
MMSQVTNGIFATPGQIAPLPTARTHRTTSSSTKLVVTDADGQVLQSWVLKQPKCTLGSAESCTIACGLPGIAPVHALIVTGARQTFVRSLAGKLSQDGIPASELLLSENKSYFELAGYRFALIRKAAEENRAEQVQAQRMRFALARPLSISNTTEITKDHQPEDKSLNAPWVANVIREAIEPLEAQIDSLLLPLAEFQAQSLQAQISAARELEEEKRKSAEKSRATKEVEIVNMVAQQSANMETLAERISDVNSQLSTIERIIAQDAELNASAKVETNKVVSVQQTAIEQLQVGMVSVSESIKLLQEQQRAAQNDNLTWKNEVQLQLQQLTSAVSEFSDIAKNNQQPELLEAIESLRQTHEVAQSEIQRWQQGVQQQLDVLQEKMQENSETVREQVPTQLAEAITEIQSKHEQTLAELQSWKSELRQEMQELLHSAFESRAQQPIVQHIQPTAPTHNFFQSTDQNSSLPSGFGNPSVFDNHGFERSENSSGNYEEQCEPEIVSDEMVHSASSQLGHSSPYNDTPVQDNETWPTLQVASDHTTNTDSQVGFGNQWSAAPTSEVLENLPAPTGEMAWNLPQVSISNLEQQNYIEQRDFVAPQPRLATQDNSINASADVFPPVHESQSFFMPTSESAARVQENYESLPDLSMSNLFPNADWNAIAEPPAEASSQSGHVPLPSNQPVEQPAIDYAIGNQLQAHATSVNDLAAGAVGLDEQPYSSSTLGLQNTRPSASSQVSEELGGSALPSWWTETTNDEAGDNNAIHHQNNAAVATSTLEVPQVDISHLYHDQATTPEPEPTDRAQPRFQDTQAGDGQAFFGLGVESFQAVGDRAVTNPSNSPSSNGSSFDRFMQREQTLADYEEEHQSQNPAIAHDWQSNPGIQAESSAGSESAVDSESGLSAFDRFTAASNSTSELRPDDTGTNRFGSASEFDSFTAQDQNEGETPEYQFPTSKPAESYENPISPQQVPQSSFNSAPATQSGDEDEESVEAYMKNLLARMRGDSVAAPDIAPTQSPVPVSVAPARQSPYELRQAMRMQPDEGEQVEPMDLENYVPLTNAPEKSQNISALRDLANTTARTAIHKSTRRRTLSGSLMKFAISAIAITVAAALFAINGVAVNIALVATMAALFVAMIWGYDGIKSLRPLLQNSLVLQPANVEPEEELEDE